MEEVSIKQLVQEIGNCLNTDVKLVPGKLTEGSTFRRCPDTTKIGKLGFIPQFSLKKGLQETVEWYNAFAHLQPKND